jgi:hypothetical protein
MRYDGETDSTYEQARIHNYTIDATEEMTLHSNR